MASPAARWRRDRAAGGDPASLISRMRWLDELGLHGLGVDLLHAGGGLFRRELGDLGEQRLGVLVAGPEPLEVEHPDPAEAADLDGGGRAHDAVHGGGHQGQLEAVGVDLPGDVHVLGVARAPRGHDRDVVEAVGLTPGLADADLDLATPVLPLVLLLGLQPNAQASAGREQASG